MQMGAIEQVGERRQELIPQARDGTLPREITNAIHDLSTAREDWL